MLASAVISKLKFWLIDEKSFPPLSYYDADYDCDINWGKTYYNAPLVISKNLQLVEHRCHIPMLQYFWLLHKFFTYIVFLDIYTYLYIKVLNKITYSTIQRETFLERETSRNNYAKNYRKPTDLLEFTSL